MRFIIILLSFQLFICTAFAEKQSVNKDGYKMERHLQPWRESPKVPNGWKLIDKKVGKITEYKSNDIFMLVTDGSNELLLWFYRKNHIWEMSVIDSIATKNHKEYGVNPLKLKIYIEGNAVLYGIEGSEAITRYEWNSKESVFIPLVAMPY